MTRIIKLIPPELSAEHIKEKITCIRAHRERIFQISTQIYNNKLICHNYGHGGAGWTFLFGSANQSIRLFEEQLALHAQFRNKSISIIGAGCYGLLSAIMLARKGYDVHIIAAKKKDIPSTNAAGFFFPRPRKSSTPDERASFLSIGLDSYKTYLSIINKTHPFIKDGPKLLPAYYGLNIDPGFAPYIQQKLISTPQQVFIDFGNGNIHQANEYITLFINSDAIMQELYRNINELNIAFQQEEIDSFDDLNHAIIFNCAGMGAKKLTHDARIIPVQGHLITLKNQKDITKLQYMINVKVTMKTAQGRLKDELIYFAPKGSGILGITFMRGEHDVTANQHEFDRILQRCKDYFGTHVL